MKQQKSQFLTICLMVLIGVMVYTGIEAYMTGMQDAADSFYETKNLQDLDVLGTGFTEDDLQAVKELDNVADAERKLTLTALDGDDTDKSYLVNFIESNHISSFYVVEGLSFDVTKKGVWLDSFYADANDLGVGDTIHIKYEDIELTEKILGLIQVPDHIYDIKDASQLLPDKNSYGFVYLSINEFPEEYIKEQLAKKTGLSEDMLDSLGYEYSDYIPFNYIMVDVNDTEGTDKVKNAIEDTIDTLAIIRIEDSTSYSMYAEEIAEGNTYVGVFSGLFLFIALLSVITTMTRLIENQRLQIGTLKALGFKNRKIVAHYVGYGFWMALIGAVLGLLAGKYIIGYVFMEMEMTYFELPYGMPDITTSSYIMAALTVLIASFVTFLTCRKKLSVSAAESLRADAPKVKNSGLKITTKGIFKKLSFATRWNIRDILRNKIRTLTGIVGVTGCCMLIVCALGMLDSMNYFVKLQFEELYNFDYKLTLQENLSDEEISELEQEYGNYTSETLGIEVKEQGDTRVQHTIFVTDAENYIRFQNDKQKYISLDSDEGIYVTYKLAETNGYELGDEIYWHIYGSKDYYKSKIVGFYKDPQNQNFSVSRAYLEKLGLKYVPDSIYTNQDLSKTKDIPHVELVQDIAALKSNLQDMLAMTKEMIGIIIGLAIVLGAIIIYNLGILSFTEKGYQFATLKVLGFTDRKIEKIYVKQNNWIAIISALLGLPAGYYLIDWLYKTALDESYDLITYVNTQTYLLAAIGTILVSYLVSKLLARKIRKIDMVSSLKGNE